MDVNFKKLDIDYLEKLTDKQKKWLYKFLMEYHHGVFFGGPLHNKKQRKSIEESRRSYRKDIYNNSKKQLIALENQAKKEKENGKRKKGSG